MSVCAHMFGMRKGILYFSVGFKGSRLNGSRFSHHGVNRDQPEVINGVHWGGLHLHGAYCRWITFFFWLSSDEWGQRLLTLDQLAPISNTERSIIWFTNIHILIYGNKPIRQTSPYIKVNMIYSYHKSRTLVSVTASLTRSQSTV